MHFFLARVTSAASLGLTKPHEPVTCGTSRDILQSSWPCIPAKGGRTPPSPGLLRPPPSYRATTPTSSMGLFETHWYRLPRQSARWALFGRRRSGSSGNGTGSSRRSSRGQPTQESILGPISMTIDINMNDGDSDAMDKKCRPTSLSVHFSVGVCKTCETAYKRCCASSAESYIHAHRCLTYFSPMAHGV